MPSVDLFEVGSGVTVVCSSSNTQDTCPSQCCWCVEAGLCADTWHECSLGPPSQWGSFVLSVVVFTLLLLPCICNLLPKRMRAHADRSGSGRSAQEMTGVYESYESGSGEAEPASHPSGAAVPASPEGQRLLDDP